MILVTFAVPQESGAFRAALRAHGGRLGGQEIRVVHLGMGEATARREVQRWLSETEPRMLICAGFAGGLDPQLRVGDLLIADNFSSSDLCARAVALTSEHSPRFRGLLVTSAELVEEAITKAELARQTGARAVDMETAAVAEVCCAAGVPLLAVRAISDAADTTLPVPFTEWYDLNRQRPRPWALLYYLARHPRRIVPFAKFARGLASPRRALRDFLVQFLEQPH